MASLIPTSPLNRPLQPPCRCGSAPLHNLHPTHFAASPPAQTKCMRPAFRRGTPTRRTTPATRNRRVPPMAGAGWPPPCAPPPREAQAHRQRAPPLTGPRRRRMRPRRRRQPSPAAVPTPRRLERRILCPSLTVVVQGYGRGRREATGEGAAWKRSAGLSSGELGGVGGSTSAIVELCLWLKCDTCNSIPNTWFCE